MFKQKLHLLVELTEQYFTQKNNYTMPDKKLKIISLKTMIDNHVGKIGTARRDAFGYELKSNLIGTAIKEARTH